MNRYRRLFVLLVVFVSFSFPLSDIEPGKSNTAAQDDKKTTFTEYEQVELAASEMQGEAQVIEFPGPIDHAISGGAGRFIIAYLPLRNSVAVLDLIKAKIVKILPAPGDKPVIAAGANHLLIYDNTQKTVSRYNLTSFELEVTKPIPFEYGISSMGMGSASFGPVLAVADSRQPKFEFFDLETLEPIDVTWPVGSTARKEKSLIKASSDGRVFSVPGFVFRLEGTFIHKKLTLGSSYLPSSDGKNFIVTGDILNEQFYHVDGKYGSAISAISAPFFLSYEFPKKRKQNPPVYTSVSLRGFDNCEALETFELSGPFVDERSNGKRLDFYASRVFFVPQVQILATIAPSSGKVGLQKIDVEKILKSSGSDYLFAMSTAPTHAILGSKFQYQIVAKSNHDELTYSLESSPEGMDISQSGKIIWQIPNGFGDERVNVIAKVANSDGQSIFHPFEFGIPENSRISEKKRVAKKRKFEKEMKRAYEARRKAQMLKNDTIGNEQRWEKSQAQRFSMREWMDRSGKRIRAKFVRVVDRKTVVLMTAEGREIELPLDRLFSHHIFLAVRNDLQPEDDPATKASNSGGDKK